MKTYNSRKKMLGDYFIDCDWTEKNLKEIKQAIEKIWDCNYIIETNALSNGLYGMNGGVFTAVSLAGTPLVTFSITQRAAVLWELV